MLHLYSNTFQSDIQDIFNENAKSLCKRVLQKDEQSEIFISNLKSAISKNNVQYYKDCGHYIRADDEGNIITANLCHQRFCTVCNKRKSSQTWHRVKTMADDIIRDLNPIWLFFTVTVQNVTAENLAQEITKLMQAINRMYSTKTWHNRVLGAFRSLEITYNKEADTYHPHYHILMILPTDYFDNENIWLSTYEWRKLWERSARLKYNSQCKIEQVIDEENLSSAIAEVAKYAVKMSEVAKTSPEALKHIVQAIKGRRLISYTGILKNMAKSESEEENKNIDKASLHLWELDTQKKEYIKLY